ncbi:MAG: sugar phosphate isomerase/epimerase [Saprospiraceae bacterium]|nr:sugar phosphate isomerase/epimerase [Saprospiraceae bacterium]
MLLWTTNVDGSYQPILEDIKRVGFDGVEIPIGDGDAVSYRQLGKMIADLELGCTAVSSVFEDGNPASPDPAIRANAVEQLKWRIDMGAELGVDVIGGPFHSAFAYFSGEPPTPDERKRSTEVLRQAAEHAEGSGIILTPEALNRFECYLYNTLDEIAEMIHAVDHPNLKMIFDTHHAHIEEKSMASVIHKHKDVIAHVHISENDRGTPGTGQVAWDEVFSNLYEIGYDRWLTIEAFSRNNPEFASGINVWRNFAPTLNEIYEEGFAFISEMCAKHAGSSYDNQRI